MAPNQVLLLAERPAGCQEVTVVDGVDWEPAAIRLMAARHGGCAVVVEPVRDEPEPVIDREVADAVIVQPGIRLFRLRPLPPPATDDMCDMGYSVKPRLTVLECDRCFGASGDEVLMFDPKALPGCRQIGMVRVPYAPDAFNDAACGERCSTTGRSANTDTSSRLREAVRRAGGDAVLVVEGPPWNEWRGIALKCSTQ